MHGIVPLPSVEVLITKTGKDFLLTYRDDDYWHGWHIPGGFMLYQESIEHACQRLARKEVGIKVKFQRLITAYMWLDHPFGSPLSLVCLCTTKDAPSDGQFFTEIPENMVNHHDEFVKEFLI